jgi:sulfur-carrier protein adenylyltransferase/sulfurtransferase
MPETIQAFLQGRHTDAVKVVTEGLASNPKFKTVAPDNVSPLLKFCTAVWSVIVVIQNKTRTVEVGVSTSFPDEAPIAVVREWKDLFLTNPHVLDGGLLCVIPNSAALESNNPLGIICYVFDEVEAILKGTGENDFREEFSYYWNRSLTNSEQKVLVVDPIEQLGNSFPAIFCKGYICVASSVDRLNRWATNWTGSPSELKREDLGVAIHLGTPLLPQVYPDTLADLVSLAEKTDPEASKLIHSHVVNGVGNGLALLLQEESGGLALGGIVFKGLSLSQRGDLTQGFRAGKVPPEILWRRAGALLRETKIKRTAVTRVDHKWIHSRGGDGRDLSKKSVLLSRAGVGRLTLTDNDTLGWGNLGRHILGASSVGLSKAEALAAELLKELPHLEIVGIAKDWRAAFQSEPDLFSKHDLVISATGDWRCERPLNALARKINTPVFSFGWIEPYAVAGHCLVVVKNGGCFECGVNDFGQFLEKVSVFDGKTMSKEPGGCTHYQQYGPTALVPIASMIASTIVDSLLNPPSGSCLHTWVSSADHFKSVGATVSEKWFPRIIAEGYSRTFVQTWNKSNSCQQCVSMTS